MATTGEPGVLATARYGKDKVRVLRVVRDPESKVHDVVEYNVTVLVEGAIETRCGFNHHERRFVFAC
jgi:urate oxidase